MARKDRITSGLLILALICLGAGQAAAQFSISGTAVDPFSAPVDDVEIRLFTADGFPIGIPLTVTDGAGHYSIDGLPSGGYIVQFRPPTIDKLVPVELPANVSGASTVRNVTLQSGFLLSGYVRDVDGIGIPDIDLQVYDRDSGDQMLTPGDDTNALGFYDVVLPQGEYDLEWRSVAGGSLPYIPVMDRVVLEEDTQIDVVMQVGWPVSGTVRNHLGQPLFNINMDFIDVATGVKLDVAGDNTDANGFYTVSLPLGTYEVVAKPVAGLRLLTGFEPAVVVAGATPGVDFELQPGHLMSGQVTGPGGAVASVDVDVIDVATGQDVALAFDATNESGFYQVVVPAGQIHVVFDPPGGSVLAAGLVTGVPVSGDLVLNHSLVNGVVLSGTVTSGGAPVPNTDLDLKDPASGVSLPLRGDNADANGFFQTLAAPGTYILEIEPPLPAGLVAQRDLAFNLNGATNLNIVLEAGARVTGTVTSDSGDVLPDVGLDVFRSADGFEIFTPGSRTDALGQYQAIVPPGDYSFVFRLGSSYASPDSVVLNNVVISGDTVVDAVFTFGVSAVDDGLPPVTGLGLKAYPNPFNPMTSISFEQPSSGRVRVSIHRLDGSLVTVLADGEFPQGVQTFTWNGLDRMGQRVASGVYLAAVSSPAGGVQTTKVALVK